MYHICIYMFLQCFSFFFCFSLSSSVLAPPPPPPPGVPPSQVESTLSFEPYGPGEGPPRPAFMPPQLRHRMPLRPPPGHRPPFPRPPMGGPPGSFGRPPGPPGPPGPYMGGPPMGHGPNIPPVGPPMNMGPMPMQPAQIGPRIPHAGDASGMGPYVGPVIEVHLSFFSSLKKKEI